MKQISDLLKGNIKEKIENYSRIETENQQMLEDASMVVNQLFEKILARFVTWRASIKTAKELEAIKRDWIEIFYLKKILSVEQIKFGLRRLRLTDRRWIPDAIEFIGMCKPTAEDIGAPSLEEAYDNAIRNLSPYETKKNWSHPAVKYACSLIDQNYVRSQSKQKSMKAFEEAYKTACDHYSEGRILDQIEDKAGIWEYQEYVGRIKADARLSRSELPPIMSYEDWKRAPRYAS